MHAITRKRQRTTAILLAAVPGNTQVICGGTHCRALSGDKSPRLTTFFDTLTHRITRFIVRQLTAFVTHRSLREGCLVIRHGEERCVSMYHQMTWPKWHYIYHLSIECSSGTEEKGPRSVTLRAVVLRNDSTRILSVRSNAACR